jgi:hypothetical protein
MIEQTAAQKQAIITLIDGLRATNIVVGEARDFPGALVATFEDASSRRTTVRPQLDHHAWWCPGCSCVM